MSDAARWKILARYVRQIVILTHRIRQNLMSWWNQVERLAMELLTAWAWVSATCMV